MPLLTAFLNPPEYFDNKVDPAHPVYTPKEAAGAIVMGSSDQVGNELDEFVTETLRNNLLGLPLDLPTINMTRARDAGVPGSTSSVGRCSRRPTTRSSSRTPAGRTTDSTSSTRSR